MLLELGQSESALVYLAKAHGPARTDKSDQLVVLKVLKRSVAADLDLRRSFLHESRLAARLRHPNIVAVSEIVELEGLPVLVSEYLEGRPLSEIAASAGKALPLTVHLRILADALRGLHYSHELTDCDGTPLRLVHRNLRPGSILVTYQGTVKLLDFGEARLGQSLADTHHSAERLRYMAPEQIAGEDIDRRTDIFAVGAMLWEAAAGEPLWRDLGETTIVNRVINGDIPRPRGVRPDCAFELERICMKAMAHKKDDRYATAAEFELGLERLLGAMGPPVGQADLAELMQRLFPGARHAIKENSSESAPRPLGGSARNSIPPGSVTALSPPSPRAKSERRRRHLRLALASMLALTLAGLSVWLLQGPGTDSGPVPSAASSVPHAKTGAVADEPARAWP